MKIQFNRMVLIFSIVSVFLPFTSFFIVGEIPPITENVSASLTMFGDFLSSQMIGFVIAIILFSISRMLEQYS